MTQPIFNYFSCLELPTSLNVTETAIQQNYQRLQRLYHPDNFATASVAEKQAALIKSAQLNQALQILRHPLKRTQHWCELQNLPVSAPSPSLLQQQWEWRERVAENRDHASRTLIAEELRQILSSLENRTKNLQDNPTACYDLLIEWQFSEKLYQEVLADLVE